MKKFLVYATLFAALPLAAQVATDQGGHHAPAGR